MLKLSLLWQSFKKTFVEAYSHAFFSAPFQIVGKTTDDLTQYAVFSIKAKRLPEKIDLKTQEIIDNEKYLFGLSFTDRKEIERQYLIELKQPLAYIAEYPHLANKDNEYIFKILLCDKRKIICGSASYFIEKTPHLLSLLSEKDIVKLSLYYYMERFSEIESSDTIKPPKNKVHYLNS